MRATSTRGRQKLAPKMDGARLIREDARELEQLARTLQKRKTQVLRELVHEALKIRRLRRAGRDETTAPIRDAQREILQSELAEMKVQVKEILDVQDRLLGMLDDLQNGLAPLLFELLFDTWTDARTTNEIVMKNLLLPNTTEDRRQGKSPDQYLAHIRAKAQELSRQTVAKYRDGLADNPNLSRRFTSS